MAVEDRLRPEFGFRVGDVGTHTSRTIMFAELTILLDAVPAEAGIAEYRRAITEDNVLGKKTLATRRLSSQRLSELYGLDPDIVLYRTLRKLWAVDHEGRPLLAILCAMARDPLLRMTVPPILNALYGDPIGKADLEAAIANAVPGRFNPSTQNKIARNAASSWTQSGHLVGRTIKKRSHPKATPSNLTYALFLAYLCGNRGQMLFRNSWVHLLDIHESEAQALAQEASRRGLLVYRAAGGVVQVDFPGFLTDAERTRLHE